MGVGVGVQFGAQLGVAVGVFVGLGVGVAGVLDPQPIAGVPEDPATGSASGPLGAYLVERGLVTPADPVDIVSEQGTRMGRPSFIRIRVAMSAGRISEILVGGSVVPVIEGRLRVP